MTGLTFGQFYTFKVESRNSYSRSLPSDELTLLCAFKPDPPLVVTTTNTNDLVTVQWDDPIANGYVIHAYRFYVLEHDGVTYTEETAECDGTNADIVNNRVCTIALLTLRSAPYNLVQGESVWVKIVSVNTYGESVISDPGNGAVIQLVPEPPINLLNDPQTTSDVLIRFTWDQGLNNGGVNVIDYDIYYDQGTAIATYILLEEAVLTQYYQTTNTLIAGETYSFKVTSRNTVGDSNLSDPVTILAAKSPDPPR